MDQLLSGLGIEIKLYNKISNTFASLNLMFEKFTVFVYAHPSALPPPKCVLNPLSGLYMSSIEGTVSLRVGIPYRCHQVLL